MSGSNRKLTNILLTPRVQLKLTYMYIGVGALVIVATVTGVFHKMLQIRELMDTSLPFDVTTQTQLTDISFQVAQISMAGFVTFALLSFVFALLVSHRIAGPVVAITAYIDELKKGNYEYHRQLRPDDELTQIMRGLHELNDVLKDRK